MKQSHPIHILTAVAALCATAVGFAPRVLAQPPAQNAAPGAMQELAVVAVANYDHLVSDINFLGSLAGQPQAGQMLEGMLALMTNGQGLNGLDKARPWGVIVQTDGTQIAPIGCLPVTDASALLALAQNYGAVVEGDATAVQRITLPNGQQAFVQTSGGWAHLGLTAESLATAPADPAGTFATLTGEYDIAARVSLRNLPQMYRQQAMMALQMGMQQGLERQPDEDDEQYALRTRLAQAQIQNIQRIFDEIDQIQIGWAVDEPGKRSYLDFTTTVMPGTSLDRQIAGYADPRTNFAGFVSQDATVSFSGAFAADPQAMQAEMEQYRTMISTARQQAAKAIDEETEELPDAQSRELVKSAVGDFFDALESLLMQGKFDLGMTLELRPDTVRLVAGGHLPDPGKVESGLRKLAQVAREDAEFPGIAWDAENHAGVRLHTMQIPVPADEATARRILGETLDVVIGIGPQSVYVAVGRESIQAMRAALDASAREPNKSILPSELSISVGQIMAAASAWMDADDEGKMIVDSIAATLQQGAQGNDRIRMTATYEADKHLSRTRIEFQEGVLRAVGQAASAAMQMQMQGAAPAPGPGPGF